MKLENKPVVRKAVMDDIEAIGAVFESARQFMRENGNPNQWGTTSPDMNVVKKDIEEGNFYVITQDDVIGGVFSYLLGDDPTYHVIVDGDWHYHEPYDVIHRVASNGTIKGITKICFDYCTKKSPHVRMDTHRDNRPMQNALRRYGFRQCGIIYLANGSERIAFDYKREV